MELKPVPFSKKPKYPAQHEVELDKTLLEHRPRAWFAKPIVGLALSAVMAAGLIACVPATGRPGKTGDSGNGATKTEQGNGNGSGNTNGNTGNTDANTEDDNGWDVGLPQGDMAPPPYVRLSDKDALIIIADELSKAGFRVIEGSPLSSVRIDGTVVVDESAGKTVLLEYVSVDDYIAQKYPFSELTYLPEDYYGDYYETGKLANELKDIYKGAAIFYDPMRFDEASAEEQLRAQVLDFIEWLLAVGSE
ncbi:MAG: hypothetical protein FWD58_00880 [Firmicutes bacterium]|nr:hypothetical protein [Bacillota bacterium]